MDMNNLPDCPVETAMAFIGDKWKIYIIRELLGGTRRFGEIKKNIRKITQKALSQSLKAMEEDGLLIREVYAQVPARVDYTLTELGYSLREVHDALFIWGGEFKEKNGISL